MTLPPGQRKVEGFPRFGTHMNRPAPRIPADPVIEIDGGVTHPLVLPVAELAELPRRELVADFHCVAGWSSTDLHWEGISFKALFERLIASSLQDADAVTHVEFAGLDGYRSFVTVADALADDVLIADRLDGRPLDSDHGAPIRLVSPSQYGFVSVKHLCRIELHTSQPVERYHPALAMQLGLELVKPHPRARVWREERHRHLPAWIVRPIYRLLIPPIAALSARGRRPDA